MSHPIHVSTAHFDEQVRDSALPVVIDFWADWCAPCHRIAPAVDELAAHQAGRARVVKVNVDEEPELAKTYGIRSIPTFVLLRDGQEEDRLRGALPPSELRARVDAWLEAS